MGVGDVEDAVAGHHHPGMAGRTGDGGLCRFERDLPGEDEGLVLLFIQD